MILVACQFLFFNVYWWSGLRHLTGFSRIDRHSACARTIRHPTTIRRRHNYFSHDLDDSVRRCRPTPISVVRGPVGASSLVHAVEFPRRTRSHLEHRTGFSSVIHQHEAAVGLGVGKPLFRRTAKGLRTRQVGGHAQRRIIIIILHTL